MNYQCALSTIDNPFNPFEQFIPWFLFDIEFGYNCCGKVMRIAQLSDEMSSAEELSEMERAIDTIVLNDFTNTYIKVTQKLKEPTEEALKEYGFA